MKKDEGLGGWDCSAGDSSLPEGIPYEERERWAVRRRGQVFVSSCYIPHVVLGA